MSDVKKPPSKFMQWIDARYPWTPFWKKHVSEYYAPKNFNIWYVFGVLSLVVLVMQILTGIFLTMHYKPSAKDAFDSVEYIMRDVPWGAYIRYMHSTGASAFFIVIYLHMFRGIMYGSYRRPRELVWLIGMFIYIILMAEAFMGYLLPWGQMSYWGAQVIVNLFSVIPFVGEAVAQWIRGDFVISDATLNRFFAFHVIALPLLLALMVFMHIVALHHVGSNNPDGVEIKKHKDANGVPLDGVAFYPYHVVKDIVALAIFLILFFWVIFFMPDGGGLFLEHANFEKADPFNTPDNIAPVWYFTPFYAILRAVPSKLGGAGLMGLAIVAFMLLPWLDRSPVKSIRYKGWMSKTALAAFVVSFIALGWLGLQKPTVITTWAARLFTFMYFAFFFTMPFLSRFEKTRTPPERITYKKKH